MLRKMLEVFEEVHKALVYGEEVKVSAEKERKMILIVINEDSPDSGLTEYLYNESTEDIEDDWGAFYIGEIKIEWMTLPEEDF